jgi:hypothetical protein
MSQATQLAVLSTVSVGMWSAKKDQGMWFLIVPRRQLFVVIVEDASNTSTAAGKRRRFAPSTANLLKQLGAHSPFSSAVHKEGGCAFAFEVSFENISGIDYQNSLIRSGRLVLEAHNTRKREFANIDSAFAYYGGADGEATRASLEALFGDSSPYKEQRTASTPWDEGFAAGAGSNGGTTTGAANNTNNNLSKSTGTAAMNPGLPPPPIRRTKTNLLARLGSAVGAATKSGGGGGKAKSSSSPAVSTATSMNTSAITIGNIITDTNEDDSEITSALAPRSTSTSSTQPLAVINTARPPSPIFLFPNPVREDASPSPTRSNLFRLSQSAGDVTLSSSSPLPSQAQQQSPFSSSVVQPPLCSTPAPAASHIYDFRLITVHWTDPQLPEILRPIIETNEGMLRLYESGLPTWATFFPRAGLYYRPWLRSLTWVLFYAFSFFSLAVGFYDLYKTLPGLQAMLSKMVAGMWLPPAAVLQWIEEHAQIRLSILLTYIFGKSEMFLYVVRMLRHAKTTVLDAAGPVVAAVGPPLQALWNAGIAPVAAILRNFAEFTSSSLQTLISTCILPLTWLVTMLRHAATALSAAGGGGGSAVAATSPWLMRAIPTDTINTLRSSLAIPTRAANSVWRSINQMVSAAARHRLTWSRRARRWRISMKKRVVGAFWLVIDALHVCYTRIWAILNLVVAAGRAGVVRQRQEDKEAEERAAAGTAGAAAVTVTAVAVVDSNKKDD